MSEIGDPQRVIIVEPLSNPVPAPAQPIKETPGKPSPVPEPERVPVGV